MIRTTNRIATTSSSYTDSTVDSINNSHPLHFQHVKLYHNGQLDVSKSIAALNASKKSFISETTVVDEFWGDDCIFSIFDGSIYRHQHHNVALGPPITIGLPAKEPVVGKVNTAPANTSYVCVMDESNTTYHIEQSMPTNCQQLSFNRKIYRTSKKAIVSLVIETPRSPIFAQSECINWYFILDDAENCQQQLHVAEIVAFLDCLVILNQI